MQKLRVLMHVAQKTVVSPFSIAKCHLTLVSRHLKLLDSLRVTMQSSPFLANQYHWEPHVNEMFLETR